MSDILLIDDDLHATTVVRAALELFGHRVRTWDGGETSEIFNGPSPQVALVDLLLPGHSGIDLLRELHAAYPQTFLVLATGMGDIDLLSQAVSAGASSMLCKPYQIADVVQLIELSALLTEAVNLENAELKAGDDRVTFSRSAAETWKAEDLARIVSLARRHGADRAACWRVAVGGRELLRNAQIHGAQKVDNGQYQADAYVDSSHLVLRVADNGPGFDWWKELARARGGMEKARASGLQIVSAVAVELAFENQGRTAIARFALGHKNRSRAPRDQS